ncbi:hypothetical protein N8940_01570 [Sphingomonadaceae bacterium]|nr:hypothetical protein [Sphingomonadaceae bacterium]
MFDRQFFASKLGKAAMASVAATVFMIAFTTQMHADPVYGTGTGSGGITHQLVELA